MKKKLSKIVASRKFLSYLPTTRIASIEEDPFYEKYYEIVEAVLSDDQIVSDIIQSMVNSDLLQFDEAGNIYYEGRNIS